MVFVSSVFFMRLSYRLCWGLFRPSSPVPLQKSSSGGTITSSLTKPTSRPLPFSSTMRSAVVSLAAGAPRRPIASAGLSSSSPSSLPPSPSSSSSSASSGMLIPTGCVLGTTWAGLGAGMEGGVGCIFELDRDSSNAFASFLVSLEIFIASPLLP
eukprot:GSChrysophyteH1.ASY1.ANO1.3312.1 assembled CDS